MKILKKPIILPMTLKEIKEGNYQFKFGNLVEEWGSDGEAVVIPAKAFTKPYNENKVLPDILNDFYKHYCDEDNFDDPNTRFKFKQKIISVWYMFSNYGDILNKFLRLASEELISYKKLKEKETCTLLFGHDNNSLYIDLSVDDKLRAAEIVAGAGGCKYIEYIEGNESNNRVSSVHTRYIDLDLSKEELGILVNNIFPTLWYYSRNTLVLEELAAEKMCLVDVENMKKENLKSLPEKLEKEKNCNGDYGRQDSKEGTWKVLWTLVKNNIDDLQLQKELIQDMIDAQEKVIEVQMKVMDYLKKAKEEL